MRCSVELGLAWALAIGLVAGCGGQASRPAAPTETPDVSPTSQITRPPSPTSTSSVPPLEGKVTLWVDWDPERMQTLIEAINGFKTRHPQVEFDISYYPTDQLKPAFEAAAAAHQGPSVIFGPSTWGRAFADQGWTRDLTPLLLPAQQSSIQPVVWGQVADSTRVLGLPLTLEGYVLYRNKSLAPDPAASVADLVETALALRTEKGFGASLDFGFIYSAPQLQTCGADLNTQTVLPFNESQGECWLGLMQRLGQAGKPVFNSDQDRAQFLAGKSAWLIDSTLQLDQLAQTLGVGDLAIDPWPVDGSSGRRLNGYVWSENAYLTASNSNADMEASWAFLAYLLAPETQAAMDDVEGARRVPSVVGVGLADPLLSEARAVLETSLPRPFPGDLNRLSGPLNTALRLVVGQAGDIRLATMLTLQEIEKASLATATPTTTSTPAPTATRTSIPSPTSTSPPLSPSLTASPSATASGP